MLSYEIDAGDIVEALSSFTGIERRFQRIGMYKGALIVDDYAHHPDELIVTLETARAMGFQRVVCLFQPHTYSRTNALKDGFISALKLADVAILTDIYSAREINSFNMSSLDIAKCVPGAIYAPSLEDAAAALDHEIAAGDIVLTCGAGTVNIVAYKLAEKTM